MEDTVRSLHCVDMFKKCAHLEGDVAECGVAFGQTTFMLDPFVFSAQKRLFAFDTFEGLPYDDAIVTPHQCKRGEMNYGEEFFKKAIGRENTAICAVKGLVEETLMQWSNRKFCFVFLDMDLYQPTSYAYKFFEDRMAQGGIIGFHDYGFHRCPGVARVVDGEVDYQKFEKVANKNTCLYIRRK